MATETATHTPGPWKVTGPNIRSDHHPDGPGALLLLAARGFFSDYTPEPDEQRANLALAASAPDLLATVEATIGSFSWLLDEASDAHSKCNLSDDTECREGSRPTDHEEIRDAYVLRRVIKTTIAQAREGEAS